MAKLPVCSVYDNAVKAFSRPMFVRAKGEAMRSFIDECGNPKSELAKHPSDYSLYLLGTFDEESGVFENSSPAELLLNAREFAPEVSVVSPLRDTDGSDRFG